MSHLLNPSPKWFPYFGNQRRFVPYVKELLIGLGAKEGDTIFETNAGSHAIGYHINQELGMYSIANDLGFYSYNIGMALSTGKSAFQDIAARGAAIIQDYGYNPELEVKPDNKIIGYWKDFIVSLPIADRHTVIRGNLFDTIRNYNAKFIYCDFAWPWRDGRSTKEYETTADTLGVLLGDDITCKFTIANGRRILQDVIEFLDIARERYEFVILSNQSSNYPIPEVLEAHVQACDHTPIISRRQTVPAEYVDDLGMDQFFTEYQYVFEGRSR